MQMGSKKRAAWSKAKSEFLSTAAEAEAVMADCENRGRRGLACYKCDYCGGWHLTSHPWK